MTANKNAADGESAAREAQAALGDALPDHYTAPPAPCPPQSESKKRAPPAPPPPPLPVLDGVELPPGRVGELAADIYHSSTRPVAEISLAAALALTAGIAGRSYNISGTGLNVYMLIVGKTGIGKEGASKGIHRVVNAARVQVPCIVDCIGPRAFASGQALIRHLDTQPCFVSILGEFGHTLKDLDDPRATAPMRLLKTVLLDLFAKSGWGNFLSATAYSDAAKNTGTIRAPCMSFIGDSTAETFYGAINTADIDDGLLPRLHVVEYEGERPDRNKNSIVPPNPTLVDWVVRLTERAFHAQNNAAHSNTRTCTDVRMTADALDRLDAFDRECDANIRGQDGAHRQLWNRAHLKALQFAALVAVGVDIEHPVVTEQVATWAIEYVADSTAGILQRFERGDVGSGESKRQVELERILLDYLDASRAGGYRFDVHMQEQGIVPYSYLLKRARRCACFYKARSGSLRALQGTIDAFVKSGWLIPVDWQIAFRDYNRKKGAALYAIARDFRENGRE